MPWVITSFRYVRIKVDRAVRKWPKPGFLLQYRYGSILLSVFCFSREKNSMGRETAGTFNNNLHVLEFKTLEEINILYRGKPLTKESSSFNLWLGYEK